MSSQLTFVNTIYSTAYAFAAVTENNGVQAWGASDKGASIPSNLDNITGMYSTSGAFAAIIDAS